MTVKVLLALLPPLRLRCAEAELPSVGKSKQRPEHVIELTVGVDETLRLRLDGKEPSVINMQTLAARVKAAQAGDANTPVVISADRAVKYEAVVKVMDTLQRAGIQRVGLSVKQGAS